MIELIMKRILLNVFWILFVVWIISSQIGWNLLIYLPNDGYFNLPVWYTSFFGGLMIYSWIYFIPIVFVSSILHGFNTYKIFEILLTNVFALGYLYLIVKFGYIIGKKLLRLY